MNKISKQRVLPVLALAITAMGISACGIKPPYVEPPEGAKHDEFPHTYPDPLTDPKPGLERKSY